MALLSLGCRTEEQVVTEPSPKASADRLAPGERPTGSAEVFGIPVPPNLRVLHKFADRALLEGRARTEDLAIYFREYALVQHVEVIPTGTVFPRVHIKGDPLKREFRIEISRPKGKLARVKIQNVTPPPTVPGLSEAERWEQAGRNPDGTLKNRLQQY